MTQFDVESLYPTIEITVAHQGRKVLSTMIMQHFDSRLIHRRITHLDETIAEIDVFARTQLFTETLSGLVRLAFDCQTGRTDWCLHAPVYLAKGKTTEVNTLSKERIGLPCNLTSYRTDLRLLQFTYVLLDPIMSRLTIVINEQKIITCCFSGTNIASFTWIINRMSFNCLDWPTFSEDTTIGTHHNDLC